MNELESCYLSTLLHLQDPGLETQQSLLSIEPLGVNQTETNSSLETGSNLTEP